MGICVGGGNKKEGPDSGACLSACAPYNGLPLYDGTYQGNRQSNPK